MFFILLAQLLFRVFVLQAAHQYIQHRVSGCTQGVAIRSSRRCFYAQQRRSCLCSGEYQGYFVRSWWFARSLALTQIWLHLHVLLLQSSNSTARATRVCPSAMGGCRGRNCGGNPTSYIQWSGWRSAITADITTELSIPANIQGTAAQRPKPRTDNRPAPTE